jgi:hypothetical protein
VQGVLGSLEIAVGYAAGYMASKIIN